MALTKVTGGLISTTSNYEVGVITATKFVGPIEGGVTGITTGSDKIKVIDESSDTTCFPLFATHSDGYLAAKSGSNLTFNSNTGALTATSFFGRLTGNFNGNQNVLKARFNDAKFFIDEDKKVSLSERLKKLSFQLKI